MPNDDMKRLDELATAYGVAGGSLGPVVDAIAHNAPHVLGGAKNENEAVMEVVAVAVLDADTFAALMSDRAVSPDVLTRMRTKAALHHPATPAAVIVDEVLADIRSVAGIRRDDADLLAERGWIVAHIDGAAFSWEAREVDGTVRVEAVSIPHLHGLLVNGPPAAE